MGFLSKILGGGGGSSSSSSPAFPAEVRALAAKQTELANLGLGALEELKALIPEDFARLSKEIDLFRKATDDVVENLGDPSESLAKIANLELQNALDAGKLSGEDKALIEDAFNFAIEGLDRDATRLFQSNLQDIQTAFTKRGLRVDTDSPVGAAAATAIGDVSESFQRQVSQLRSAEAREKLNRPLQKAQVQGGLLAQARGAASNLTQFKLGLQEGNISKLSSLLQQRGDRLQNVGAVSTAGIPVAISGLARAFNQQSTTASTSSGIGGLLSAGGSLFSGLGAAQTAGLFG